MSVRRYKLDTTNPVMSCATWLFPIANVVSELEAPPPKIASILFSKIMPAERSEFHHADMIVPPLALTGVDVKLNGDLRYGDT